VLVAAYFDRLVRSPRVQDELVCRASRRPAARAVAIKRGERRGVSIGLYARKIQDVPKRLDWEQGREMRAARRVKAAPS
jgi:hypothetical protein